MSMILEYAECMDMGPLRSDSPFNMKSSQIKKCHNWFGWFSEAFEKNGLCWKGFVDDWFPLIYCWQRDLQTQKFQGQCM